jgi:hypothetical protein
MSFEIVGFESELDTDSALPPDCESDDHIVPISFEAFFPSSFMRLYTDAETFAEFMQDSPWQVTTLAEFDQIPEPDLDVYVDDRTEFRSWTEMLRAAGPDFIKRVQNH